MLRALRDLDNTVLRIEHDLRDDRRRRLIVDFARSAGRLGG